MSEVIHIASPTGGPLRSVFKDGRPAVNIDAIHVVYTTSAETLAAARVAAAFGRALHVPLTVVHFRAVPYALTLDGPTGLSPTETDAFVNRLREEGVDARVRVYLCRSADRALPLAFKRRSVIILGGRRSWWPTSSERLRRRLEAAGHFVVFVDGLAHKETFRA